MLWIFLIVITTLICAAARSDPVMAELGFSNIYRNSPFVLATLYGTIGVFTLLTTAIFINSAALREIASNTQQIVYSTSVRRRDHIPDTDAGKYPSDFCSLNICHRRSLSDGKG